jgi:guanylate kinase
MTKTYNKMIVITAPSGAGKTSITHHLMQVFPQLRFSISAATRLARDNEKDGVDYYFISEPDFQKKILANEFVEWEMVYEGKYYGTLKSELERIWSDNKIPVMDIDVQGAIHVQKEYPVNSLFLFIQPPSIKELKKRLQSRGSETQEMINVRINKASFELSFKNNFQDVIVNENLTDACRDAEKVVADFIKQ